MQADGISRSKYFWVSSFILPLIVTIYYAISFASSHYTPWYQILILLLVVCTFIEFKIIQEETWGKSVVSLLLFGLANVLASFVMFSVMLVIMNQIYPTFGGDMAGYGIILIPILFAASTIISGIFALIAKAVAGKR